MSSNKKNKNMKTLKSIGAVFAGMIAVFALSHLTDLVLEKTGILLVPFHNNPLWLMLFVTFYRCLYVVAGAYVTAALAPAHPMRHVWTFAGLGCVLGTLGAVAMWHLPPHWYPVSLVILGVPSAWLGGKLKAR
jgi:hypothetical protein